MRSNASLNTGASPRAARFGRLYSRFDDIRAAIKTVFVFGLGAFLATSLVMAVFPKESAVIFWTLAFPLALVTALASLPAVPVFRAHSRSESVFAGMAVVLASSLITPVLSCAVRFQSLEPEVLAWSLLGILLGTAATAPLGAALGWLAHTLVHERRPGSKETLAAPLPTLHRD